MSLDAYHALFDDVCDAPLFQVYPDERDVVDVRAVGLDALEVQDEALAGVAPDALVASVGLAVEGWEVSQDVLKEPKGRMVQVVVQIPAVVKPEVWKSGEKGVRPVAWYLGHAQDPGPYWLPHAQGYGPRQ